MSDSGDYNEAKHIMDMVRGDVFDKREALKIAFLAGWNFRSQVMKEGPVNGAELVFQEWIKSDRSF